jgi:hypothetical protein
MDNQRPLFGQMVLVVIGLHWADSEIFANIEDCEKMANGIALFYANQSRNLFTFTTHSWTIKVPQTASKQNLPDAEGYAKRQFKLAHPSIIANFYVMLSSLDAITGKAASNSGKGIAHVRNLSVRTGCHEVGHLIGLAHSGAWKDGVYNQYADGYSVMSGFSSNTLAGPQYLYLGWIPENEVAVYRPKGRYVLKRPNDDGSEIKKSIVVIPHAVLKPGLDPKFNAYVTVITIKNTNDLGILLHLSSGPDSKRIKLFKNEYHDTVFTNLKIATIERNIDNLVIMINVIAN